MTFLCLRIAGQWPRAADVLMPWARQQGQAHSMLLIGLPGTGKTTLLRDLARQLASGKQAVSVSIADERSELAACVDGVPQLQYLLDHTRPETLALEPDLGWMEVGGGDCAEYLTAYRDRCPVIHLKDYYSSDNAKLGRVREFVPARGTAERGHFEFRPTGYGVLNLPKLMPLCLACDPEWFVMDHDLAYERDPYNDLKLSLDYTRALLAMQPEA